MVLVLGGPGGILSDYSTSCGIGCLGGMGCRRETCEVRRLVMHDIQLCGCGLRSHSANTPVKQIINMILQ